MGERRWFKTTGCLQGTEQAGRTVRRALISAALAATAGSVVAADAGAQQPIGFERQVLRFAPSRADLAVGIVWVSVFTPDEDWTVKLPDAERANFEYAGKYKYLELKPIGKNQFELPPLTIEARKDSSGPVCVSVKAWFNEVSNVYDSLYYSDVADRQALLAFCTRWDERAGPRQGHNRVATLQEFRASLGKPLTLNLRQDIVPWRPGLFVDGQGAVYFHSLLIGRHTEGTLSHHVLEAWKLGPDRKLTRIAVPDLMSRPTWPDRVRQQAQEPFDALIRIASTEPVARDAAGNLYARFAWCQKDGPPPLSRLVRIDATGGCHAIAGSSEGHRDGKAGGAQFFNITALAVGPDRHVYVADGHPGAGSWIRRVAPDGTVTTLAGSDKVGFADGAREAARFHLPSGLAVDRAGNVYVADPVNSRVRKVTPEGVVTTIAGMPGGPPDAEAFVQPSSVAVGSNGSLYILDGGSQMARVRMISADARVETLIVLDANSRKQVLPGRK